MSAPVMPKFELAEFSTSSPAVRAVLAAMQRDMRRLSVFTMPPLDPQLRLVLEIGARALVHAPRALFKLNLTERT
jgi:hypothetical protein